MHGHGVFYQAVQGVDATLKILLQNDEHAVFEACLAVDDEFKLALLDVAGRLGAPNRFNVGYLMAKRVIHKFLHKLNKHFGFYICSVLVAPLQMGEQPVFLHLTQEKTLERVDFDNRLGTEVIVLEIGHQLALVVRIIVQKLNEFADPFFFVFKLHIAPNLLGKLRSRQGQVGGLIADEFIVMADSSLPRKQLREVEVRHQDLIVRMTFRHRVVLPRTA